MLRWHTELEPDARLLAYARGYGDRLLTPQDESGFFPGWLHPQTRKPGPVMNQTPETSLSVTFLLKLAAVTGDRRYETAAIRAMDAVLTSVVPAGLWLDFETFWSCCSWGKEKCLGRKIDRNALHKQNTLSMFWTAEAATRILDHYGHVYLDRARGRAFAVDTVRIRPVGRGWEIVNETGQPRTLRLVRDDGSTRTLRIEHTALPDPSTRLTATLQDCCYTCNTLLPPMSECCYTCNTVLALWEGASGRVRRSSRHRVKLEWFAWQLSGRGRKWLCSRICG